MIKIFMIKGIKVDFTKSNVQIINDKKYVLSHDDNPLIGLSEEEEYEILISSASDRFAPIDVYEIINGQAIFNRTLN